MKPPSLSNMRRSIWLLAWKPIVAMYIGMVVLAVTASLTMQHYQRHGPLSYTAALNDEHRHLLFWIADVPLAAGGVWLAAMCIWTARIRRNHRDLHAPWWNIVAVLIFGWAALFVWVAMLDFAIFT